MRAAYTSDSEPSAESPEAVLVNLSAAEAERAATFSTVAEREGAALVAAAAAQAQVAERFRTHAIARTTDADGNLRGEFLILLTPEGAWQLERYAVGLPATVCDGLAPGSS